MLSNTCIIKYVAVVPKSADINKPERLLGKTYVNKHFLMNADLGLFNK